MDRPCSTIAVTRLRSLPRLPYNMMLLESAIMNVSTDKLSLESADCRVRQQTHAISEWEHSFKPECSSISAIPDCRIYLVFTGNEPSPSTIVTY